MSRLAVLILTFNEEKNIAACMRSVAFADEIVVVDSGSTDATKAIVKQAGGKFVEHKMTGFADQRNFALTQTDADWVLYLDADERIMPEAAAAIFKAVAGERLAYEIRRESIVFGKHVRHGGFRPDYSLRLYPRDAVRWEGVVHESAQIDVPLKRLDGYMEHYTYTEWGRYFAKLDQYTTLMAEKMYEKGKRAHFIDITLRPAYGFFRFYILQSGWRDGRIGFVLAMLHIAYTLMKYVKLYDIQESGALNSKMIQNQ